MIIAVDFDNTLTNRSIYPITGKINLAAIMYLNKLKGDGHRLVLFTARSGKYLDEAVNLCKANGLEFDGIEPKFEADIYIDDKAIRPEELW